MIEQVKSIVILFVEFGIWWGTCFAWQWMSNIATSSDLSVSINQDWGRFFGVPPKQRVLYLRPVSLQILALVYLIVGGLIIVFHNSGLLKSVRFYVFVPGFVVWSVVLFLYETRIGE